MVWTSYTSERSVEYALVGRLRNLLKGRYRNVIPIFPWAKREGSKLSLQVHTDRCFKVLCVYARRPKLRLPADTRLFFKFNEALIRAAETARPYGIPTIAGCPVARDLLELADCERFVWVDLLDCSTPNVDPFLMVNEKGETDREHYLSPKAFSDLELLGLVDKDARPISFVGMMEAVKNIRLAGTTMYDAGLFGHFGGYKPVYFLLC